MEGCLMDGPVLVDGATFACSDADGGVGVGLFHRDTRYLSELSVTIDGAAVPVIDVRRHDGGSMTVRHADSGGTNVIEGSAGQKLTDLVIERRRELDRQGMVERIEVTNHGTDRLCCRLTVGFSADFADLFEVRDAGVSRERSVDTEVREDTVRWEHGFEAVDGSVHELSSRLSLDPVPDELQEEGAVYAIDIGPQESVTVAVEVSIDGAEPNEHDLFAPVPGAVPFLAQARQDLASLVDMREEGPVVMAGVPWFVTVFGRDSLLTALLTLEDETGLAAGTLRFLAARQGQETDPEHEEEPGRILHELRSGELALCEDIPFSTFYGSIDATPLWIVLLGAYHERTGDTELVEELADPLRCAADWLIGRVEDGDDPFVYYAPDSDALEHHGWKDAPASVIDADGDALEPPIALAEVQGYVYDALRRLEGLADVVPGLELDGDFGGLADDLAAAFDDRFWLADREMYALAVDGSGRVADVVASDQGHCLWSGIVPEERAGAVADALFDDSMLTRWGVRTLSADATGYSPVSYHRGSVWPHDNAIILRGLERYGLDDRAAELAGRLADLGRSVGRMPELVCGFDSEEPVPYPSACAPQAWSAAAALAVERYRDREDGPVSGPVEE